MIIIETTTTTRERLVLVPVDACSEVREGDPRAKLGAKVGLTVLGTYARDATAADLERAGWVPLSAFVGPYVPLSAFVGPLDLLSPPTLAGALEAIGGIQKDADRWEGELATVKRDYADIQRQLGEERERAETAEAARDALRDQITAAGCEAAHAGERTYECDVARPCGLCRLRTRAEKAERERDEATARNDERLRSGGVANYVADLRAERDALLAELARLTAPGSEGSLDNGELVAAITRGGSYRAEDFDVLDLQEAYRLGGAHMGAKGHSIGCKCGRRSPATKDEDATIDAAQDAGWQVDGVNDCAEDMCPKCQRARHAQPAKDRATDEELVDLYRKIYETHGGGTISVSHDDCRRAGVRTVAARVRQERCLVAQAVAMRAGVTISRTSERVPGTTGMWDVYVTRRPDVPGEHYAYGVAASDVPATLARLLGEVSRG